jgi:hypothetical protein
MTRRFHEREGPFGGRYWEDDDGNKIHEREGPFGRRYTEDDDGNKIQDRKGPFGGRFVQDADGNTNSEIPGASGPMAVDSDGKPTRLRSGPFGGRWVETDSATPIFPEPPAHPRSFSLPRPRFSRSSNDDDTWSGIGFLLTALFVLVVVVLFVYIGVPILAGVWLAKFVNRRWVEPVPDRHRWRWAILPAAFAAGALPTNELVATGFGALNCSDPQSVSCANYRLAPTPTVLGLHRWLVQRDSIASQPPQAGSSATSSSFAPPYQPPNQPPVQPTLQQTPTTSNSSSQPLARLRASDPRARINLRNEPNTQAPLRGFGAVGDQVAVLNSSTGADGLVWLYVLFPASGAEGWIRSDFVDSAAAQPNPSRSNAPAVALERDEALRLIERWLAAKGRIFAPPFDTSAMAGVVGQGPLRHDITKANGSIDWLRANNSRYSYQSARISAIQSMNLSGSPASITVLIDEQSTFHGPKGDKPSATSNPFLYTFVWEDGRWQILDARKL